jgi:DNA-binding helix-hairpin-helix protein with protein kinase domain
VTPRGDYKDSRAKPALYDLAGRPLHLGPELGSGGEGAVYEVRDRSDVVVKLYHKPLDSGKSAKIAIMAKFGNERLLRLAAWPTEPAPSSPRHGGVVSCKRFGAAEDRVQGRRSGL